MICLRIHDYDVTHNNISQIRKDPHMNIKQAICTDTLYRNPIQNVPSIVAQIFTFSIQWAECHPLILLLEMTYI